jgi:hypothetical protein
VSKDVHVCNFSSGLDHLTRRKQAQILPVLEILHRAGKFSMFEATANRIVAKTMDLLERDKYIEVDYSTPFPWLKVKLTEKALAIVQAEPQELPGR